MYRWALNPISVISDIGLSLISDWESGVRHYIEYRNKVLSDIQYPTSLSRQTVTVAQWYNARVSLQGTWFRICRMKHFSSSMSDIGMSSDVDIGTLPILEWRFSVWHICLRYRNNRCQCQMSDIADIENDVDAHLCTYVKAKTMMFFRLCYGNYGNNKFFWKLPLEFMASLLLCINIFFR
jgi:hypothetical protein